MDAICGFDSAMLVAINLCQFDSGALVLEFSGNFIINGGKFLAMSAPRSIEFDKNMRELCDNSWEVLFSEDKHEIGRAHV